MKKYDLKLVPKAARKYEKLCKKDPSLVIKLHKVFDLIVVDPKDFRLNSHKVNLPLYGVVYSSRVTDDIRLIWEFSADKIIIFVLDIGGHSGKRGVYK